MHRPLRTPFHLRVWNLIKGILLYNTVYWEKASDGLKMASLTREEREQIRPKADYEIIKPRGKPRARLEVQQTPKSSFETQVSEPPPGVPRPEDSSEPRSELPESASPPDATYVKRRKYKRRRTNGGDGGNSFFRRVFGKER